MKVYSKVWLTSFGDLLTLLLCFAVVAIYNSKASLGIKNESNQAVKSISQAQGKNSAASGKQIASKEVTEFPHLRLSLAKEDFRPSFAGLNSAGSSKLKDFLEQDLEGLEVGVCDVGFNYSEAAFETLSNELGSRNFSFLMGAAVCKSLQQLESKNTDNVILVSANRKVSHG